MLSYATKIGQMMWAEAGETVVDCCLSLHDLASHFAFLSLFPDLQNGEWTYDHSLAIRISFYSPFSPNFQ